MNGRSSETLELTPYFIIFIFRYLVAKRMEVKVLLMNQWQVKRQGNFKAWFTTWWWVFSICSLWIQQLIPKLRIWIFTNFLTNQNKLYKSCFFWQKQSDWLKVLWKLRIRIFGISYWIRRAGVIGFVIFRTVSFQLKYYDIFHL